MCFRTHNGDHVGRLLGHFRASDAHGHSTNNECKECNSPDSTHKDQSALLHPVHDDGKVIVHDDHVGCLSLILASAFTSIQSLLTKNYSEIKGGGIVMLSTPNPTMC